MIHIRARGIFFALNRGNKPLGRHSTRAKINNLSVGVVRKFLYFYNAVGPQAFGDSVVSKKKTKGAG
jgi:hypothetical protein